MNPEAITARSGGVLIVAALLCEFLAAALCLTAASFGIELGDLPEVRVQDHIYFDHAGNIAMVGMLFLEIAATWALIKVLNRGTLTRLKAGMRAVLVFIGLGILSYAIMFAALMGFALYPVLYVSEVLANWILTVVS
jgi:hypothetical protein